MANIKPLVAGIGELLWDVLPTGKQLGGAPCNFAFHAMQAGCDCEILSAIGTDDPGNEIKAVLSKLGLRTRYLQENEYPTSTVTVKLDDNGHPDFFIHENVAWDHIRWKSDMEKLAKEVDAVCFGSLAQRKPESEYSISSFLSATKPGCLKVFDINLRQKYYSKALIINSLNLSDILKLNEDELPVLEGFFGLEGSTEEKLEQLISRFKLKFVVFTLGSKGSFIKGQDEFSFMEAPVVKVVDTVGAGDAFTAVFITGLLTGIPLREIHETATEISAFVCTQKGATPFINKKIFKK
jgi:fructokinase